MTISRRALLCNATLAAVSAAMAIPAFPISTRAANKVAVTHKNETLIALYDAAVSMRNLIGTPDEHLLAERVVLLYEFALNEYPAPRAGKTNSQGEPATAYDLAFDAKWHGHLSTLAEDVYRWPEEVVPYVMLTHVEWSDSDLRIFLKAERHPRTWELRQEFFSRDA